MIDRTKFAARLKELRQQNGMSLNDVAKQLGITRQALSLFETEKSLPSADKLVALADFFDVSLDYLVGRSDDPTRR